MKLKLEKIGSKRQYFAFCDVVDATFFAEVEL